MKILIKTELQLTFQNTISQELLGTQKYFSGKTFSLTPNSNNRITDCLV